MGRLRGTPRIAPPQTCSEWSLTHLAALVNVDFVLLKDLEIVERLTTVKSSKMGQVQFGSDVTHGGQQQDRSDITRLSHLFETHSGFALRLPQKFD